MKNNKKLKLFKVLFIFLFIAYITIYASQKSGYIDFQNSKKAYLTKEKIIQFENDVKEGKDVDITDYMKDKTIDYSNTLTRTTVKVSTTINKYLKKGIESVFKILNSLVES